MPRERRKLSSQDCYHIVLRGKKGGSLFQDEQDLREFRSILDMKLEQLPEVLMDCFYIETCHFHGILYAKPEEVTSFCTKVTVSYAWAYNNKYKHTGGVFEKRFLSEPIDGIKEYHRISQYIEHHKAGDTWRLSTKCCFERWQ